MKSLVSRQYFVFGAIGAALLLSAAINHTLWDGAEKYALEVNMAGKQRMLSYKILNLALTLEQPSDLDTNEVSDQIKKCAGTLVITNAALISHDESKLRELQKTAFPCISSNAAEKTIETLSNKTRIPGVFEDSSLNNMVVYFAKAALLIADVNNFSTFSKAEFSEIGSVLLPSKIDQFVAKRQFSAESFLKNLRIVQASLLLIIFVVTAAMLYFILMPEAKRVLKLQNRLTLLQKAISSCADGIVICRTEGRDNLVEYSNPAFCAMTGHTEAELLGRDLRFLQGSDTNKKELNRLKKAIRERRKTSVILENYRANGQPFWNELNVSPVVGELGDYYIGEQRDVSQRVESQAMLADALATANIANEAKSSFLATMSHEFRTPLNAIIGFSEMLQHLPTDDSTKNKTQEYAQDIHKGGMHMLSLVNDILDLSEIQEDKRQLEKQSINIETIVDDCIQSMRPLFEKKNIEIISDIPSDLSEFSADERSMHQILINLLSNAIKYSNPNDKISVLVKADESYLSISVIDTGLGISPDILPKILEPFTGSDADPHIAKSIEGTGLGLSIVNSLSKQHGGEVLIESEIGKGTTVEIKIPIRVH